MDYKPAWWEPDDQPITSFGFTIYSVHTDKGIVGHGPYRGDPNPYVKRTLTSMRANR